MNYWLFKTEPDVFGLAELEKSPKKTTFWDGVRNYQARNLLRDDIAVHDRVLWYHSRVKPMACVGVAKVVKAASPDPTQFDRKSKYYDEKATKDEPRWFGVDVRFEEEFATPVTLDEIKEIAACKDMVLINRSRLSVQPVRKKEFDAIVERGRK